jgi:hypothetical protein
LANDKSIYCKIIRKYRKTRFNLAWHISHAKFYLFVLLRLLTCRKASSEGPILSSLSLLSTTNSNEKWFTISLFEDFYCLVRDAFSLFWTFERDAKMWKIARHRQNKWPFEFQSTKNWCIHLIGQSGNHGNYCQ